MRTALLLCLPLLMLGSRAESAAAPTGGGRCSLAPFLAWRDASATSLLATALPDTVAAGKGEVRPTGEPGHWGNGRRRDIYGQVVRVMRVGGADSAAVHDALEGGGGREAVLVPWDYDPMCAPTPWSASARWSPVGAEAAYTARLRPREHWAGGRPTFDVFMPDFNTYPHGSLFRRRALRADGSLTDSVLTAAEFFTLYQALPSRASKSGEEAEAALARWEAENPDARERFPAAETLEHARRSIARGNR